MTTKHTPGPWEHRGLTMISGRKADGVNFTLANVTPAGDLHDAAECAANARLIAAAPELLVALKTMLREHDAISYRECADRWPNSAKAARAAIAKAEGAR